MDIKQKLVANYEGIAIYTAGFYADPENDLATRAKLLETLKSFVLNQQPETPFSLQIMLTNGEINIMPLGLVDLDELKAYEKKRRQETGIINIDDGTPLNIQFAAHTDKATVQKQLIGTTQELFDHFEQQFQRIWAQVKQYLQMNHQLLLKIETDLIEDSRDIQTQYSKNFSEMSTDQRREKVGFDLPDQELNHFSTFMADMHEVSTAVLSSAAFIDHEVKGDLLFTQMMADSVLRGTFFWVLDNTFHEIFYYFQQKYGQDNPKLTKHFRHVKQTLIVNMRHDAYEHAKKLSANPQTAVDLNRYFTDIFIPVAEQLAADSDKFN
ncbi:hypothetical protein [Lentilactobacillus farraginis]|uniref:Uncharacterized protein n=2 Tax=Lentilactobacillus farraginis DSM 18382 = JCM 14108 TaxID=1423743 RepID=A0A0R1VZS9_9LACO|nr:hypothetical protein [Lentilactobacillus farraginis]KRM07436.1 hypothetical protein FD41_GL000393 [Lentilactobacillus farraginis DSM 18382 = JCM 14108]